MIDSYLTAGTVAEQDPAGRIADRRGVTVHISISNGVAPTSPCPSVKGLTPRGRAGRASPPSTCSPSVVYKDTSDPKLDGVVYGMNPDAGTSVLEGSSVTLLVWAGPPEPSPSPSPGNGNGNGNNGTGNGNGGNNGNGNALAEPRAHLLLHDRRRRPGPSPCPSRSP